MNDVFRPPLCGGQSRGHHVVAKTRRSHGSVKPASREADGAKRSGLTEPWTAGQSRVVMAVVHATVHVIELASRSRRAGGREAGGGDRRPPRFRIQSECALTNMNAVSGENLTSRVLTDDVVAGASQDTGGALRSVTDRARFCRTTRTCIWGVSDSRKPGPEPGSGGGRRGSLTPQMPPSPLLTAAPAAARAAKSAAPLTVVKLLIAHNIPTSPGDAVRFAVRRVDHRTAHKQGGTTAPESVVPPLFLCFRPFRQPPGECDRVERYILNPA